MFRSLICAVSMGVIFFGASDLAFAQASNYAVSTQPQLVPYSTQAQPGKGQSYVDATFRTTVTRVTASKTDSGYWGTMTGYSTWDPLSSDRKYLILLGLSSLSSAADYLLYDANTFQLVGHLPFGWYNGQDPEPRWDTSGSYPARIYYRKDKQLRYYDVVSKTDALVHDFTADFPSYGSSFYIYNGEEGISSRDSRFWGFMLRNGASPYQTVRIFVYDKALDKVIASRDVTGHDPDNVSMSPSGNYMYVAYEGTGGGGEFDGPHAYTRDFAKNVKISGSVPHLSYGTTVQGHEVAVFMDGDYISFTRLDNGQIYRLYYQGDLGWDASNLLHTATGKPGWGFISTYSENYNYWDYNQVFAIELDETKTYSSATKPRIWRISFTQNIVGPNYYYQQPNAQISYDGSKIWWGANWRNVNGTAEVYQATLPTTWWNDLNGTTPTTPTASTLACTPTTVAPGGSSTCTVTLNMAAPVGGAAVALSSSSSSLIVPASVTVVAGTTSGTFTAFASPVTANTAAVVTATYGSGTALTTTLTLTPPAPAPALSNLTCNPLSITGALSSTCTVTLSAAAPTGGLAITLSDNSSFIAIPASVTVAAGSTSATFTASISAVTALTTGTVTAAYGGVSKAVTLTLNPAPVALSLTALSCSPTTLTTPASSTCTVTLSAAAPTGGLSLAISDTSAALTVPGSITVAAGSTKASFTASAALVSAAQTATVTASFSGGTKTASIQLLAPADTTAPSVAIKAPLSGATVSGTISASASASDNVGVVGVQFLVDGKAFGSEVTASPYTIPINTTQLANAVHSIAARARDAAGNTTTSAAVSVTVSNANTTTFTPIRINAGGATYTDSAGRVWAADNGYNAGLSYTTTSTITNTTDATLYRSVRYNPGAPLQYRFSVPNGTYTVRLKFAEVYYGSAGQRVFNIVLNGQTVQSNFDPVAAAGGSFKAIDRTFTANVTNGQIALDLTPIVDNPDVNAIEITAGAAATPSAIRVNSGGSAYTDPSGQVWAADTGYVTGFAYSVPTAIANTTTPSVYQSVRYNYNAPLQYRFSVPNGTYTVRLKFAELYWAGVGQRVFNIVLNGQTVQTRFDAVAAAGGAYKAVDRVFTVNVTTGQVALDLTPVVDNPAINGIEITPSATAALRINAGGPAYTDATGQVWAADTGYVAGTVYSTTAAIANTTAAALYQNVRFNRGSTLQYRFAVPNGTYTVKLKFAEIYYGGTGQRVFNIVLNGQTVQSRFDAVAAAGAAFKAVDRAFTVTVSNGQIALDLVPVIDNPSINAVEITAQ